MKVLWISPNGGNYKKNIIKGTGGWIGALQDEITTRFPDLELGIAFISQSDNEPIIEGRVTYLPAKFSKGSSNASLFFHDYFGNPNKDDEIMAGLLKKRIDEYRPDVIHVWGTEGDHASVIPLIETPFIVHIQGLTSLCFYNRLPYGYSERDLHSADFPIRWLLRHGSYKSYQDYKRKAKREIYLSKYVKYWMGRTEWDKIGTRLLSPDSHYFHCEEVMRNDFMGEKWHFQYDGGLLHIHSSINPSFLKGFDVVLNTALILKNIGVKTEWNVFGVDGKDYRTKYTIHKLKINPSEVGVKLHGFVPGDVIRNGLLSSDVFVHPSYMENSSNAIAEAMLLGVPTIAHFVGGNPTMLKDDSGLLVPPNEPFTLANAIMEMRNKEIAEGYSQRALNVAEKRQNNDKTVADLINIYEAIIKTKHS